MDASRRAAGQKRENARHPAGQKRSVLATMQIGGAKGVAGVWVSNRINAAGK
jgi:hypothetical protein